MTIDVPSKKNGARKGRRESEELRLEASKILGITPPPSQKYGGHHPRAIVATLVSNNDYQYRLDESSDFEDGRRRSSRANKNFPARPYWETNTAKDHVAAVAAESVESTPRGVAGDASARFVAVTGEANRK
jgi:hypothetical protein